MASVNRKNTMPAFVMKLAGEEARIDVGREKRQADDPDPVLDDRERKDSEHDHGLLPAGLEKLMAGQQTRQAGARCSSECRCIRRRFQWRTSAGRTRNPARWYGVPVSVNRPATSFRRSGLEDVSRALNQRARHGNHEPEKQQRKQRRSKRFTTPEQQESANPHENEPGDGQASVRFRHGRPASRTAPIRLRSGSPQDHPTDPI